MFKEMTAVGAHFGYSKSVNHPSTRGFVFGYKNRLAVIDLSWTEAALRRAKDFLRSLGESGGKILLVGTKAEGRQAVKEAAEALNLPYVSHRWLGGTLTNFVQIKKRIDRFLELKAEEDKGLSAAGRSKRQRAALREELVRLGRNFSSLASLDQLPAALVVVDSAAERIAVTEAARLRIPTVSLSGTDCDIADIEYPVVANDANLGSIRFFVKELVAAYEEGRRKSFVLAAAETAVPQLSRAA